MLLPKCFRLQKGEFPKDARGLIGAEIIKPKLCISYVEAVLGFPTLKSRIKGI
jgi:hypothetical protein